MFNINKITSSSVVDFAAEELKKYLRMMMPECGDVKITYAPNATDGFKLGIMSDFELDTSDAKDLFLDDILYIDCNTNGGIISGSNERSVLLSVYEYLRQNGCRWLMPGIDGEFIPIQNIVPVKYRYMPSCKCRSFCYEGAIIQGSILDMIDLCPKVGMNTYMLENREILWHYNTYYTHRNNEENRKSEEVSEMTFIGWRRALECEIAKRGLVFHAVGHGWTADPFKDDPEYINYLAMLNGKRALYQNAPVYTNVCMSNPIVRKKICDSAVKYASAHSNIDYLHIWLADLTNNHCECEDCQKKTPSDWYIILLNEMEEALVNAGLNTRLVFISYVDTMWAPECEKLNHPEKFTLLFAPISRSYASTLLPLSEDFKTAPYVRNQLTLPSTLSENLQYLKGWDSVYSGLRIAFEYHFWRHNILEPTGIGLARRIIEDVKAYKDNNIDGMIEDGTVRCFFPNGYAFYSAARSMFDISLTEAEIAEDYFPYVYGNDWKKIYSALDNLNTLFNIDFMEGNLSTSPDFSSYYNLEHAKDLEKIPDILSEMRELIKSNYTSEYRVRTVAIRLLEHFADYVDCLYRALYEKSVGNEENAEVLFKSFLTSFGKRECEIEKYYDHFMTCNALSPIFKPNNTSKKPIIV